MGFDHTELARDVDAATRRLLDTVATLDDGDMRAPSLLPGWSRGHVLTHIARNADGLVNLLGWVHGERVPMYESREVRNRDIEAGSGRSAQELLADVRASADRFTAALAAVPDDGWDTRVVRREGDELTTAEIPLARLVEVEVHHADLTAGYGPDDWPGRFAVDLLDILVAAVPISFTVRPSGSERSEKPAAEPVVSGSPAHLAAWLAGRSAGSDLTVTPSGPLPEVPTWR
jgi:maleylpyruvate isomerase